VSEVAQGMVSPPFDEFTMESYQMASDLDQQDPHPCACNDSVVDTNPRLTNEAFIRVRNIFAIIADPTFRRAYSWGVAEVDNLGHSDFPLLKEYLFRIESIRSMIESTTRRSELLHKRETKLEEEKQRVEEEKQSQALEESRRLEAEEMERRTAEDEQRKLIEEEIRQRIEEGVQKRLAELLSAKEEELKKEEEQTQHQLAEETQQVDDFQKTGSEPKPTDALAPEESFGKMQVIQAAAGVSVKYLLLVLCLLILVFNFTR
jgi:hypothetical protein